MLELRGVRHRYEGRVVLHLEQFTVPGTGTVAVVGHNGAGKSTLLRLLALLEAPTEGQVFLNGAALPRRPPASLRRRVTRVEQRPVLFRGTVRENLVYGLEVRGLGRTAANGIIGDVVDRLGLQPLLSRRRHELSDGEVQRVAVARALALRTDVLLLDEPASSAVRAAAGALYRALADGRLSPVTPENLFRVELPVGDGVKSVRVGSIEIVVMTDRAGPAVVAVPPTDIFVSREPLPSSARNVFKGRVTGLAIEHRGAGVHVRADMGGVELVAAVTAEAARDLALTPGGPVVFSFKATAVQVF